MRDVNAALIGWFALSIACDVLGQLCFKRGAQKPGLASSGPTPLLAPLLEGWVIAGICVYAVEIVVWLRVLSLVPLSTAFPIASLNFLAVTAASRCWLSEPVGMLRWFGAALVTLGVVLVGSGAATSA